MEIKYKIYKKVALFLAFTMLFEIISPLSVYALTSGPTQPEFSSFEPVATTNMVNEFSGDFTYNLPVLNVPGANGGGYALSLSYHSGASPEEEASWVGYGWTLNPGAIIRNKRGFPDDCKGSKITYYNDVPANWTVSVGGNMNFEAFSYDLPASLSASIRYNNYKGFGYTASARIGDKSGISSLGYSVSDGEGSFSASVNPAHALSKIKSSLKKQENHPAAKKNIETQKEATKIYKQKKKDHSGSISLLGSNYGIFSFSDAVRTANNTEYRGQSYNVTVSFIPTPSQLQAGVSYGLSGSYSRQKNVSPDELNAYGYMYSGDVTNHNTDIMDYYAEKDIPFYKKNEFLSIPFSNADNFSVTGEGLGGGFKLYNRRFAHFYPNYKTSKTVIVNVGGELEAGLNIGGGGDIGVGYQTLKVKNWANTGTTSNLTFASSRDKDEPYFFRFNNDLGGKVEFASKNEVASAELNVLSWVPGAKAVEPVLPHDGQQLFSSNLMNQGNRSGRSSYIAYHTNKEMNSETYKSYEKATSINSFVNRGESSINDGIGEIVTFNEEGNRYVYGLPVYSRNETNFQYGLKGISDGNIYSRYLAYRDINNPPSKVGEERNTPYAASFLLTEITTPDYIDRLGDGPTADDFGGWTKFNYVRAYGSNDKSSGTDWYTWRIPYNGLLYNRGSLSDPDDDMGTVAAGEKEIYYLESVETKTHIAKFITSTRKDGIEAPTDKNTAATSNAAKGTKQLKKLDQIKLYAKDANGNPGKLIKTVNFDYDYSLMQGLPNSTPDPENQNIPCGKLTLKKVWFEYEGVVNAKVSPYLFRYEYPLKASYAANIGKKYPEITSYAEGLTASDQNPSYSESYFLDSWGNYQKAGNNRHENMMPWVSQQKQDTHFDPAAWQLKSIQLPSGGEIQVQYEQKEYSYVQDKKAMAMISLDSRSHDISNKYYLNLADMDIATPSERRELIALMQKQFIDGNEKIYFKFLYQLKSMPPKIPELSDCNAEYITGYANVKEIGEENGRVYIKLSGVKEFPYMVCRDFVKKERSGKMILDGDCSGDDGIQNTKSAKEIVVSFLSWISDFIPATQLTLCAEVNFNKSYFKIPLVKPKKGGGVRVKRILMYDKGIETGDEALYGSEYIYQTKDPDPQNGSVISSGVATNEPPSAREDNTLVTFMKRFNQGFLDRLVSGKFKDESEGPIGESILPAPSIGYSRVVVKNIHSGKTNTGFTVNEFYTAKDYPFTMEKNYPLAGGKAIDMNEVNEKKDWMLIPAGLVNYSVSNVWSSQGFRFILNNMHGQPKRNATYSGDYNNVNDENKNILTSEQVFSYFEPGEKIPLWQSETDGIVMDEPGKEMEVAFEMKSVNDVTYDGNVEFDVDAGLFLIPIPFGSIFPSLTYNESKLRTHTTSKIIRYPAIQKSVMSYQDGIYHLSQNTAFSPETGKPLITRTSDGFDKLALQQQNASPQNGSYVNYTFPASVQYKEMGQKALNERAYIVSGTTVGLTITSDQTNGLLSFSGNNICDALNKLSPGDFISINNGTLLYHIGNIVGNKVQILPAKANPGIYPSSVSNIEVIRSGRTNQLNASAGSITTYGSNHLDYSAYDPQEIAKARNFASALTNGFLSAKGALGTEVLVNFPDDITYTLSKNAISNCSMCHTSNNSCEKNSSAGNAILIDAVGIKASSAGNNLYNITLNLHPKINGTVYYEPNPAAVIGNCKESAAPASMGESVGSVYIPPIFSTATITTSGLNTVQTNTAVGSGIIQPTHYSTCSNNECTVTFPGVSLTDKFDIDPNTGQIVLMSSAFPCMPSPAFTCVKLCYNKSIAPNVLAANAQNFKDDWDMAYAGGNTYETGAKGKWRKESDFTYKSEIIGGSKEGTTERIYNNAGVFKQFELFNWKDIAFNNSEKWLKLNTVTKYSPHGEALEERNILDIYSTAKFGYHDVLPVLIAQNASYGSVQFESFENVYGTNKVEDGLAINPSSIDNTKAHSGGKSYHLPASGSAGAFSMKSFTLGGNMLSKGMSLKLWVKDLSNSAMPISGSVFKHATGISQPLSFYKIAKTGEWTLYEAKLSSWTGFAPGDVLTPSVSIASPTIINGIWIDDVRVQPLDAQMTCYVYDVNTLRTLAIFDDQHFGLYYQYNGEGKLVRKLVETERGVKTVQETQYHTPTVNRNQ